MNLTYWGKSSKEGDKYLSVWDHSINVAAVAKVWLQERPLLLERWTKLLELEVNQENCQTALNIALHFIMLHDLGKYDFRFQVKQAQLFKKLNPDSFNNFPEKIKTHFNKTERQSFNHGGWGHYYYSTAKAFDEEEEEVDPELLYWNDYMVAVGIHHGNYFEEYNKFRDQSPNRKNGEMCSYSSKEVDYHLKKADKLFPLPDWKNSPKKSAISSFLAGLCTVSDWLGSNEEYFKLKSVTDKSQYLDTACREKNAKQILTDNHLLSKYSGSNETRIKRIFPGFDNPELRPLQEKTTRLNLSEESQLLIIEAPTGEGKTEAALILADRLLEKRLADNIYFALPTMATSNAMYERVNQIFKEGYFFNSNSSLVLAHGKKLYKDEFLERVIKKSELSEYDEFEFKESGELNAEKNCAEFFVQSHKRSLLASVGVGTIDQAMSSVLNQKHHWVKLFGLTNSIVIIDEIHAYDAYMTEIIAKLIQWLLALGSHVILLSATLPQAVRTKYFELLCGKNFKLEFEQFDSKNRPSTENDYPLISHCKPEQKISISAFEHNPNQEKEILFKLINKEQITKSLIKFAREGAQCCLIFNTVGKAQEFYLELKELLEETEESNIELTLFHSRFTLNDRNEIEGQLLSRFGKNGDRITQGRILIATQVVEQSIDLDFDVMISEIAPIDLLLQRAGRLHRHNQNNKLRENKLWNKPCLFVYSPCLKISEWLADPKTNENARSVYAANILYSTATLFDKHENQKFKVQIPAEVRSLIEKVYAPNLNLIPKNDKNNFEKTLDEWEEQKSIHSILGKNSVQPEPDSLFRKMGQGGNLAENDCQEEDSEAGGTRLAQPSTQIIFADPNWLNQLSSNKEGDNSYHEFKKNLQCYSLSIMDSMLTKKGNSLPEGSDLETENFDFGESWQIFHQRFAQEFRYGKKPLILPLIDESETCYTFSNSSLKLTYTKEIGLLIEYN